MELSSNKITLEKFEEIELTTEDRIEFYNGEIIYMSPTSIKHSNMVGNIYIKLREFLKNSHCKVYSENVSVLFRDKEDCIKVQPDIFVVCENSRYKETITSTPLIIFEVLSKTTQSNDLFNKAKIYEKFKVKEYNILSQEGKLIQYTLNEEGKYELNLILNETGLYKSTVFEDLEIELDFILCEQ